MSDRPDGERISHYRVVGELGRDALGPVLSAVDEMLDRPVALKVVHVEDAYPADMAGAMRERYTRNAQRAARVSHPGVVTIYGYERTGHTDILVMELVEGETLLDRLSRGERWAALDAAVLVARIADGVAAAHARQLAHGHITPQNVVIQPDGRVKILDLGVPKATGAELASHVARVMAGEESEADEPAFQQDVMALARLTSHLIAGAIRTGPEPDGSRRPVFPDPARVLMNLGVLAPILGDALAPREGAGFADAAAFRDALLEVHESARRRETPGSAPAQGRRGGAPARSPGMRGGAILHADGPVARLAEFPTDVKRPGLVLPPDLAAESPPSDGHIGYVVPEPDTPYARLRHRTAHGIEALSRFGHGRGAIIAAASVVLVLAIAAIAARKLTSGGASAATVAAEPAAAAPEAAPPASAPVSDGVLQAVAALDSAAALPAVRTGQVTAGPPGTAITLVGGDGGPWLDEAELSVREGDSLVLRFVRPGYVARTAVFRGAPIDVALQPDSVTVRFEANVPAEVFLEGANGERPLGRTGTTVQLPTGAHRIVFRAPYQEDWAVTRRFATAGDQYTVRKADYATTGGLVATVDGAWAWVSIDGGDEHETPHRFTGLRTGPHVLRLRRDGFRTVVDTVVVRGGETLSRRYSLER